MAKDKGAGAPTAVRSKGPAKTAPKAKPPVSSPLARAEKPAAPKAPFNPAQFSREVQAEARKISWTSWKETWITSVMVAIMVVVTALFFLVVDGSLSFIMHQLLQFAG
jgi:preprotein translocase subunit SecE